MNDLIKRLRVWARSEFGRSQPGHMFTEAADRLTAMKAAGDGLAGFAGHDDGCATNDWKRPIEDCTCGLTAALKQWKEASDGL